MDEMLTGYRMHITNGRLQQSFNQLGKVHRVTIQKSPKKIYWGLQILQELELRILITIFALSCMHNLAERLLTSWPVELNSIWQLLGVAKTFRSQNREASLLNRLCQTKCISFLIL